MTRAAASANAFTKHDACFVTAWASSWCVMLFQELSKLPFEVWGLLHGNGAPRSLRQVRARRRARPDPGPAAPEQAQVQDATAPPALKMGLPST